MQRRPPEIPVIKPPRRESTDWVSALEVCGIVSALLFTLSIIICCVFMAPTDEQYAAEVRRYEQKGEIPGYVVLGVVYFGTLLAVMAVTGYLLLQHRWGYRRIRPLRDRLVSRCPSCGYDTRANRDRCPECGRPIATGWMAAQQEQDARVRSGRE